MLKAGYLPVAVLSCFGKKVPKEADLGERWERRLWRMKRPERVAAVGRCQGAPSTQADAGYRNRKALTVQPFGTGLFRYSVPRLQAALPKTPSGPPSVPWQKSFF